MGASVIRILHTNDLHGTLDDAKVQSLVPIRETCDLYFDSGDCIKTGNLGVPLGPEPVWGRLASLKCSAGTLGNRESHVLRSAFDAKVAGASHPLLCANLFDRGGTLVLPATTRIEVGGIKVGILGVMVPMVTERMVSKSVSQLLWTQPIPAGIEAARQLRSDCDLVIALTHIGLAKDKELAEAGAGIDIIFGGHSHSVLETPLKVGETTICQGGSHGRFYGLYEWDPPNRSLDGSLVPWT